MQFHGWYQNEYFIFLAMEYMEYGDLARYLKERKSEVQKEAKAITKQILRGLEILHENKICHRDLKPEV